LRSNVNECKPLPYSRELSAVDTAWIFIATDWPGSALSTCLWFSSMEAILPMSMNPWQEGH